MINAHNISAAIDGNRVLSGVSINVEPGEHIALVGPNGAGKTTLLRIFAGLLKPEHGHVEIEGSHLLELSPTARARAVSYLPQYRELAWDLTVENVAALGFFAWGAKRYEELAEASQASVDGAMKKTGAFTFKGRSVRKLSGGEQARVHLARTLVGDRSVFLLDEPCASLDIRYQLELMRVLEAERESGTAIITVLHDLSLAERFATRLIVLEQGKVVADTPGRGGLTDETLSKVFGLRRESGVFLEENLPAN